MKRTLVLGIALLGCTRAAKPTANAPSPTPVPLPGGSSGIGFDDLRFAPSLRKVLVPAGATGNLVLIDPVTRALTAIPGFTPGSGGSGHGEGTTSADEGNDLIFAIDRTARRLDVVDPASMMVVADAPLAAGPDYVRWVSVTHEVWVTEPNAHQIEVFALPASGPPRLTSVATIRVTNGPESLVIDETRGRAYTHQWSGTSHAIDLTSRAIVATWENGCAGSRGIGLDARRGFLFVGCEEGKAVVLDVAHDGHVLASSSPGVAGVDIIAYNAGLGHLYLPGGSSGTMAILAVSPTGPLTPLAIVATAGGAHCASEDDRGNIWVYDPDHGQLLVYEDTLTSVP